MKKGQSKNERALIIIKPDIVNSSKLGEIITLIESHQIQIISLRMVQLKKDDIEKMYTQHKREPYYDSLISSFLNGKCVLMIVEGENLFEKITDLKYRIRKTYAIDNRTWAVMHCSSNRQETQHQIEIFRKYLGEEGNT